MLFLLFFVVPGDPVEIIAGGAQGRAVTQPVREAIEAEYGLDKPVPQQYLDYWKRTVRFDLGRSYDSRRSVNDILAQTAVNSVRLAFWALIIETLIGIAVGVVSAVKRYSFTDTLTTVSTAAVSAVPVFVLGYLMQNMFGIFPFQHGWPEWAQVARPGDGTEHVGPRGHPDRRAVDVPRAAGADARLRVDGDRRPDDPHHHARGHPGRLHPDGSREGVPERRVIINHALRNAMIPVVTLIGLDLGGLIGSAILTETVFNWPGMGSAIARALTNRDAPVVMNLTLVLVVLYVLINLVVDISYGFFDPRIRYGADAT